MCEQFLAVADRCREPCGSSTPGPQRQPQSTPTRIDKTSHNDDVAPPIGLSTTFDDGADHVYSRISAPTRQRCEAVLAALEGGEGARAVLFASGNAATHAVLASLAARARENGRTPRVATDGIGYHGTRDAVAALGPAVEVVGGAADLGEGDVVCLESPRNPDLRVPDVAGPAPDPLPWSSTRPCAAGAAAIGRRRRLRRALSDNGVEIKQ